MTNDSELLAFVTKFDKLLRDGMKARLVMECDSGHARVNFELFLIPSSHLGQRDREQHHQARAQRVARPARQRRRERLAEARVRQASEDAAVQGADSHCPPHPGPAGGAVPHPPPHLTVHSTQDPAGEAGETRLLLYSG